MVVNEKISISGKVFKKKSSPKTTKVHPKKSLIHYYKMHPSSLWVSLDFD
jgi:hypothetical protein